MRFKTLASAATRRIASQFARPTDVRSLIDLDARRVITLDDLDAGYTGEHRTGNHSLASAAAFLSARV